MSQSVTPEEVAAIARLARLGMTPAELARVTADLTAVLNNFSQIQQIDTAGVPTSDDVTGLQNVTRSDLARPEELCLIDQLLERAPDQLERQIKVKAVLK